MSNGRRSVYSPMQRFRRPSFDEEAISLTYNVTPSGKVPNFEDVRHVIYPIVKPWTWIKKAKEALQSVDSKTILVSKQISNLNLGIIYGLCLDEEDNIRYISSADLISWRITEKEIAKYAHENMIKQIGLIEKNEPLFLETQTGIYYSHKLKNLTSSLLAIPEVFNMIPFKSSNNYVVLCPGPDLILVSHSHDPRGLCLIGELSLRHGKREAAGLSSKAIRITKSGLSVYEASVVRNEATVPCNKEQLKTCKKSVFKRSRKLSEHRDHMNKFK